MPLALDRSQHHVVGQRGLANLLRGCFVRAWPGAPHSEYHTCRLYRTRVRGVGRELTSRHRDIPNYLRPNFEVWPRGQSANRTSRQIGAIAAMQRGRKLGGHSSSGSLLNCKLARLNLLELELEYLDILLVCGGGSFPCSMFARFCVLLLLLPALYQRKVSQVSVGYLPEGVSL